MCKQTGQQLNVACLCSVDRAAGGCAAIEKRSKQLLQRATPARLPFTKSARAGMNTMKSEPFELVISKLNSLASGCIEKLNAETRTVKTWMRAEFQQIKAQHVPYASFVPTAIAWAKFFDFVCRHLLDVPDYESDSESDFSVCGAACELPANVSTQTPPLQAVSAVTPSPCKRGSLNRYTRKSTCFNLCSWWIEEREHYSCAAGRE